jgi:hypothetical protein
LLESALWDQINTLKEPREKIGPGSKIIASLVRRRGIFCGKGWGFMNLRKLFRTVMFSAVAFGLQSRGLAQPNLVDFNNWTAEAILTTVVGGPSIVPPATNYPPAAPIGMGFNSASFNGGYGIWRDPNGVNQNALQYLMIYGQLATIPGASYEISGTLENPTEFAGYGASLSFGNSGISLPETLQSGAPGYANSYDFDTILTATSAMTTMSFSCEPDFDGGALDLSNLSVTEVPEVSVGELFFLGMGSLMLARLRAFRKWQNLHLARREPMAGR